MSCAAATAQRDSSKRHHGDGWTADLMASKGFENWTEADVAAHRARIDAGRTNVKSGVVAHTDASSLNLGHPGAKQSHVKRLTTDKKRHKYRAEPCIVTSDFTLFTTADLQQLAFAQGRHDQAMAHMSLKARARLCGIVGEWFGSLKEGRRWIELRQLQTTGAIRNLRRQVPYELAALGNSDMVIGCWNADFVYDERVPAENMSHVEWREVVEDVKGGKATQTALYKWKRKHVSAQYGITIRET